MGYHWAKLVQQAHPEVDALAKRSVASPTLMMMQMRRWDGAGLAKVTKLKRTSSGPVDPTKFSRGSSHCGEDTDL